LAAVTDKNKRERILAAAEDVFTRKGLAGASIAEIARQARVTDSVIYQFFKGKEDLLFSIAGERMPPVLALLEESLQGIRDAVSMLSKTIWFHLHYHQTNPGFARLLVLECRSHSDFYLSTGYALVREYAAVMVRILEDGVKDGVFRDDVDMRLVRDIIFGTLDFEVLSFLVTGETKESTSDLDDIMALIMPMINKQPSWEHFPIDKADRMLMAAERVFAERGFNKAKVADVARMAEVAEGTVYEYFQSKEDLLLSIPAKRFQDHMDQLHETFEIRTPLGKLQRLIRNHFSLYLTNRDFLKVFIIQIQLSQRFYSSKAYETFRRYWRVIELVIEEGKEDGSFRPDINPRVFRNLFLGAFSHMTLRWFILDKGPETDKMREIDQIIELLALSVLTEEALSKGAMTN
jgi:TetR/AcrR family transcriptional regulator, fatty acid metabolism regulator protein